MDSRVRDRVFGALRSWKTPSESVIKWAELTKTVIEIVAVVVAGWWAYSRFFAAEAPSLEERGATESSLEWLPVDDQRCTAIFGITVNNIGKRSFNINGVQLNVWLIDQPKPTQGIVRFNPREWTQQQALFHQDLPRNSFVKHFGPGAAWHDDYVFSVPRTPSGKHQTVLFTFEPVVVTEDGKPLKTDLQEYRWSGNCETSVSPPETAVGATATHT
jgi:hypothetical protein